MAKYAGPEGINPILNKILELIPDEKNIPGTNLYVEGGISEDFYIVEDNYLMFPLDISLQNHSRSFSRANTV